LLQKFSGVPTDREGEPSPEPIPSTAIGRVQGLRPRFQTSLGKKSGYVPETHRSVYNNIAKKVLNIHILSKLLHNGNV
jgi:hypothetical protein